MIEILSRPAEQDTTSGRICETCPALATWEMLMSDGCWGFLCDKHAGREQERIERERDYLRRGWNDQLTCEGTYRRPHELRRNVITVALERI